MKAASAALPLLEAGEHFRVGTVQDIMVATSSIELDPPAAGTMVNLLSALDELYELAPLHQSCQCSGRGDYINMC